MQNFFMWSQKHQPQSLDECILEAFPEHVQKTLQSLDQETRLPNILLYGAAGTGKSTIARLLSDKERFCVLKPEGSLVTKEDIAKLRNSLSTIPLYGTSRLIFIDEADGMTYPAQLALRSLIDPKYDASWLMTCNFRKRLIEPVQSRFMQIECTLPPASERPRHIAGIVRRLKQILHAENIFSVPDEELFQIANDKYPDIRQTINEVQLRYGYLAKASAVAA